MLPTKLQIREAQPGDAGAIIAYLHRLTDEPHNNISLDPGQWTMTEQEEHDYLAKRQGKIAQGIFCVAEIEGELVAVANLDRGSRLTNAHSGSLAISVDAKWRGRKIASALMQFLIDWAHTHGLVRLELKVFTRNTVAIHLYEKFGFKVEGRHPHAFCKQGIWVEDLSMGLLLLHPL